jgi:hypothetical protein
MLDDMIRDNLQVILESFITGTHLSMTRIEQKWGLCQTLKSNLSRMKTPCFIKKYVDS